jgi:hypothetical protein
MYGRGLMIPPRWDQTRSQRMAYFMNVTDADRKRLGQIARDLPYACTMADLKWLVNFAEKLLKERDANANAKPERRVGKSGD